MTIDELNDYSDTPSVHPFTLGLGLFLFWWLLSGHATPLLLALGGLSTLLVVHVTRKMRILDHEAFPIHLWHDIFPYWMWLGRVVIKANALTVRSIFISPKSTHPQLIALPCSQKTSLGQAIYANSLTLTPGTLALHLDYGQIWVHALTPSSLDSLEEMDVRVSRLEGLQVEQSDKC